MGLRSLAFNHSSTGTRPDGGHSTQTKLRDQVGTLDEELLQVAFWPKLDADGLLRLIVPLDPLDDAVEKLRQYGLVAGQK